MSQPSRDQYLESKVLTASQPKLHMMLLDGALRFGRQAKDLWTAGSDFSEITMPLSRMLDIVEELVHGLSVGKQETSKQLEEQYAFIYRELAACQINQDLKCLDNCLEQLAYHRETWKMACELLEAETATPTENKAPTMPHFNSSATASTAGFSFEA